MGDWIEIFYQYYKKYGGIFFGSMENNTKYLDGQLILEKNNFPLLLSTISAYGGNGELISIKARARMQTILDEAYHLEIRPMNILLKGLNLITKQSILVNNEELNKNYQIHSNNKEYTKMILPNSSLSQCLIQNKGIYLAMYPIKEGENLHIIDIISMKNSQTETIEMEDLIELVEISAEAYQTLAGYKS